MGSGQGGFFPDTCEVSVALFLDILLTCCVCFRYANDIQAICEIGEIGVLDFGIVAACSISVNVYSAKFEALWCVHVELYVPCCSRSGA